MADPSRLPVVRLSLSGASRPGSEASRPERESSPVIEPPEAKQENMPAHDADKGIYDLDDAASLGEFSAGGTGSAETDSSGEETFRAWLDESIKAGLAYPERARRRGIEGTVILSLTVAEDGSTCAVSVSRGSGSQILDRDALRFVKSLFPAPIAPGREFTTPLKIQYLFTQR